MLMITKIFDLLVSELFLIFLVAYVSPMQFPSGSYMSSGSLHWDLAALFMVFKPQTSRGALEVQVCGR